MLGRSTPAPISSSSSLHTTLGYRLKRYLTDLLHEARKVTWPTPVSAWQASLAVLRVIFISLLILSLADFLAYFLIQRLFT